MELRASKTSPNPASNAQVRMKAERHFLGTRKHNYRWDPGVWPGKPANGWPKNISGRCAEWLASLRPHLLCTQSNYLQVEAASMRLSNSSKCPAYRLDLARIRLQSPGISLGWNSSVQTMCIKENKLQWPAFLLCMSHGSPKKRATRPTANLGKSSRISQNTTGPT